KNLTFSIMNFPLLFYGAKVNLRCDTNGGSSAALGSCQTCSGKVYSQTNQVGDVVRTTCNSLDKPSSKTRISTSFKFSFFSQPHPIVISSTWDRKHPEAAGVAMKGWDYSQVRLTGAYSGGGGLDPLQTTSIDGPAGIQAVTVACRNGTWNGL